MIVGGFNDWLHLWYSGTALNLSRLLLIIEKQRVVGEGKRQMDEISNLL